MIDPPMSWRPDPQTSYLPRALYEPQHEAYRMRVRAFLQEHAAPNYRKWEEQGYVDRAVWQEACRQKLLYLDVPTEWGGQYIDDFRYNTVMIEEIRRAGMPGIAFETSSDITVPYLIRYGSEAQKERWLPGILSGDVITAIGMSEPSGGSDLANIQTSAVRDGDAYVVNGEKMWITNGYVCDLLLLACKTDPAARHRGISLLWVDTKTEGFERKELLQKMGYHARDVARLAFHDMRVPVSSLLGEEGGGFRLMMQQLPRERLGMAVNNIAMAELALDETIKWCRQRETFGRPLSQHQHVRFRLVEMKTEVQITRIFVDRCIADYLTGVLQPEQAAMAKWWTSELQRRVVDQCLQFFGGRGYLRDHPLATLYTEGRVETIYGGATEIMKEIVARSMEL